MTDNSRTDGGMFAQVVETSVPMPTSNMRSEISIGDTDSSSAPGPVGMTVDQVMANH